jgi:hypothetical protein
MGEAIPPGVCYFLSIPAKEPENILSIYEDL